MNFSDRSAQAPGRIVVAMSGGVDSSVVAAILCRDGYEVIGVTLDLHGIRDTKESEACGGMDSVRRARAIADQLGIPHHVLELGREFEQQVLRPAWEEYAGGRTPSPCLLCNERIKFGALLEWSRQMSASHLATGHYARVETLPGGELILRRGVDKGKDQSYFLAGLTRVQLASVLFPLGHLSKPAVRELAHTLGLSTADQKESQDACMSIPDQIFADTLRERFGGVSRPGPIVDDEGNVVGRHEGIHRFTVGQRRGIGVSSSGRRWVKAVRSEDAAVVLTGVETGLHGNRLEAIGINWLGEIPEHGHELTCRVQIRYRHAAEEAIIRFKTDDHVEVVFRKPVRAITPGQAAVFYDGDRVLGRGWISIR